MATGVAELRAETAPDEGGNGKERGRTYLRLIGWNSCVGFVVKIDPVTGLKEYFFPCKQVPRLHWTEATADHLMTQEVSTVDPVGRTDKVKKNGPCKRERPLDRMKWAWYLMRRH